MRLGTKFTLLVVGILVVTLGLTLLYMLDNQRYLARERLLADSRSQGELLARIAPDAIIGYDFLALNDYVERIVRHPDVVYAAVFDTRQRPMTSFVDGADPLIRALDAGDTRDVAALRAALNGLDHVMLENIPVVSEDKSLGTLVLALDMRRIDSELASLVLRQATAYGIIVVILALALYTVFRFKVLRPIGALARGARRVAEGNYESPVERYDEDEIGTLTDAFNAMMEEVRQERDLLDRHANFDTLTGLPNRKQAMERIVQEINRSRRGGPGFALLFLDMDNFKLVNDTMGHATGDRLLVEVGRRLAAHMRSIDLLARLGGDEFLMVVSNCSTRAVVETAAQRLVDAFDEPVAVAGHRVHTKFSVGAALYPEDGQDVDTLLAAADNAMYSSKRDPDTAISFFRPALNDAARRRIELEQDIYHALERGELSLRFQPIVGVADGRHVGAEALVRWHHPRRGLVPPAEFIPVAEQTGQIRAIGDWVLTTACCALRRLQLAGLDPGQLAVNVSRKQLQQGFGLRLVDVLRQLELQGSGVVLEITESSLMDDDEEMLEVLDEIRAAQVRLALDDFGTGYSSLGNLRRFRFDVIKVDRLFVEGLPGDRDSRSLVGAIIAMARNLQLEVVAEGVETEDQRRSLQEMGSSYFQGHLHRRPLTFDDYRAYLATAQGREPDTVVIEPPPVTLLPPAPRRYDA